VRNNDQRSREFVDRMDKLYRSYAAKAKHELRKISTENDAKRHLENLTDLASVQV
jgi:geranylgeranyl pyrophosphate synthase